jgi:uncharacterized protein (DUF2252 family)
MVDAQTEALVDQIVQDNEVWTTRDPALLAGKYAVMEADPYDFMRGTAGYYLSQQSGTPTAFLTHAQAGSILLVGDPHPENFGTFLVNGGLHIDVNDLDGAAYGPWLWDVRRAALGLGMVLDQAEGCGHDCRTSPIVALAQGYVEEIERLAQGLPPVDTGAAHLFGGVVDELLDSRIAAADADALRETWAPLTVHGRELATAALDEDGRGQLPLNEADARQLAALLAAWDAPPEGFRVLDTARRYGVGVASRPAVRYTVLWDQGEESADDDRLLQLREVVAPPVASGVRAEVPELFVDQADRVRSTADALWADPFNDPLFASVSDGVVTFKLQSWSDWQTSFDHEALLDAAKRGDDLDGLGRMIGQLLASAHARAPRIDGQPGLDVLMDEVLGRADALADELVDRAAADVVATRADHARFAGALVELGPWLGADFAVHEAQTR